jgi:hypothetical protein
MLKDEGTWGGQCSMVPFYSILWMFVHWRYRWCLGAFRTYLTYCTTVASLSVRNDGSTTCIMMPGWDSLSFDVTSKFSWEFSCGNFTRCCGLTYMPNRSIILIKGTDFFFLHETDIQIFPLSLSIPFWSLHFFSSRRYKQLLNGCVFPTVFLFFETFLKITRSSNLYWRGLVTRANPLKIFL